MVRLCTLLFLPTTFLLVQRSSAKKYCKGDNRHSGCWMCPESELGQCWQGAVAEIDKLEITQDLKATTEKYCKAFASLAKCWTTGTCCSEYSPLLSAATNFCNLHTWPEHKIAEDELKRIVGLAHYVQDTIWHNDSGVNVPKLAVSVKAYSGSSESDSTPSDSYGAKTDTYTTKSTRNSSSHKKPAEKPHHVDHKGEERKSNEPDDHSHDYDHSQYLDHSQYYDHNHAYSNKQTLNLKQVPSSPELKPHDSLSNNLSTKVILKGTKVHHQAKCAVKATKCQTKTADKYHQARSSKTKKNLSKRVEHPLTKRWSHHNPDLFKRTAVTPEGCGNDFQGVPYPTRVPETVAKVYAEL